MLERANNKKIHVGEGKQQENQTCPIGRGQKRPLLVPWHKSYTHDGGLSLCHGTSSIPRWSLYLFTCANLYHQVGLQGRGKILWNEFCPFHEITGFTLTLLYKVLRSENSEESRLFKGANLVLRPAWGNGNRGIGHSLFWELLGNWNGNGNGNGYGQFEKTRNFFLESLASRRGSLCPKITIFLGVEVSRK